MLKNERNRASVAMSTLSLSPSNRHV